MLKNYEVVVNNLESLEATTINLKNGEIITIISVYNSPSNSFNKSDLEKIFKVSSKVFAAGDYNSKNRAWGSSYNNSHGKKLLDYCIEKGIQFSS